MHWFYLLLAGAFEWGWPVGLKLGWSASGAHYGWLSFALLCMTLSGAFLMIAQRHIPIGTAYAVWTGIGAVGTFLFGIALFGDNANIERFVFVGFIVLGIIGLKFSAK